MNKNELKELLKQIKEDQSGATLHDYREMKYLSGFQYSKTENSETNTAADIETALRIIDSLKGSCGIWFYENLFYIETSYHTQSLETALHEAKKHNQISVYDWKKDSYINVA